ncbi:membrane protein insertion efficiency factor YidD [Chitinophaga sp. SYP-B3965]|uniref:membrane protein insertion efficiency factor YidD n=1 Tax=Chitinophaga sp. SYP-B3965 TaxID=2663120 RepID=UPI001299A98B|nr:membrane protein insertion efficiency factor YidD [Chitinophaga sp. SYP-B3965]
MLIHLYWLVPKRWRRACIFKETCSSHIYKIASEKGTIAGIRALRARIKKCRPGYSFYKTDDGTEWIILADSTVVNRNSTNI